MNPYLKMEPRMGSVILAVNRRLNGIAKLLRFSRDSRESTHEILVQGGSWIFLHKGHRGSAGGVTVPLNGFVELRTCMYVLGGDSGGVWHH